MNEAPRPADGKTITMVAIAKGEPLVTYGKVLVSKSNLVALAVPVSGPEELKRFSDAPVTLLYASGELSYVLRGRVTELVQPDRVIVSTPGAPRIGERREYIRAQLDLPVRVEATPSGVTTEDELKEWVASQPCDASAFKLTDADVDLSGSGARFKYPTRVRKGDPLCVTFLVDWKGAPYIMNLQARTVRCRPAGEGDPELAVEFADMTEEQKEILNFVVFQARARNLGISGMQFLEER